MQDEEEECRTTSHWLQRICSDFFLLNIYIKKISWRRMVD